VSEPRPAYTIAVSQAVSTEEKEEIAGAVVGERGTGLAEKARMFAQFMYRHYFDLIKLCAGDDARKRYLEKATDWKVTAQYLESEEIRQNKYLSWGKPRRRRELKRHG